MHPRVPGLFLGKPKPIIEEAKGVLQVDLARSDAGLSLSESISVFGDLCDFNFNYISPEWTVTGGDVSDDLEWAAMEFDF